MEKKKQVQNNISRIHENLDPDMYDMASAIRVYTERLIDESNGEKVSRKLRLKIVWHILSLKQSSFYVPPALTCWLVEQERIGSSDALQKKLLLDQEKAWEHWRETLTRAGNLNDGHLVKLLKRLREDHPQVYEHLQKMDDTVFPNGELPFTRENLNVIQTTLGLNLGGLNENRLSPEFQVMISFRRLLDHIHDLLQRPVLGNPENDSSAAAEDTLFTALCRRKPDYFAELIRHGADPNTRIDNLPIYYLTLQPQFVNHSLRYFTALEQSLYVDLQEDVFDLLLEFDVGDEALPEAVRFCVDKFGPFPMEKWQEILQTENFQEKQQMLACFAHEMIPRMDCWKNRDADGACEVIQTVLDSRNKLLPALVIAFLDLAEFLDEEQKREVAEMLTERISTWNAEIFQIMINSKLLQLDEDSVDDLLEYMMERRIGDGGESCGYRLPKQIKCWLDRMIEAGDDDSFCRFCLKLMELQDEYSQRRTIEEVLEKLKEGRDKDFVAGLILLLKQHFPEVFWKALERLVCREQKDLLERLRKLKVLQLEELDDEFLAEFLKESDEQEIIRLKDAGGKIGLDCLKMMAKRGMLGVLKTILEDRDYLEARHLPVVSDPVSCRCFEDDFIFSLCDEALRKGRLETLEYLLDYRPELLTRHDEDGQSLLHALVGKGGVGRWERRAKEFCENYRACLNLMIDRMGPESVNEISSEGTPLSVAAAFDNMLAAKLFLDQKADPDADRFSRNGPAILRTGKEEMVECLRNHHASLEVRDAEGTHPLLNVGEDMPFEDFRKRMEYMPRELITASDMKQWTLLHAYVKILVNMDWQDSDCEDERKAYLDYLPTLIKDYGLDINAEALNLESVSSETKGTVLELAMEAMDPKTIDRLIELGADVRRCNAEGENLLFRIANSDRSKGINPEIYFEIAYSRYHLDFSQCNYRKQNVLFSLCDEEKRSMFDYAVKHGADPKQVDDEGRSLLYLAAVCYNIPLIMDLLDMGVTLNNVNSVRFLSKLIDLGLDTDVELDLFKVLFRKCLDAGLEVEGPAGSDSTPALFQLFQRGSSGRILALLRFWMDELHLQSKFLLKNFRGETLLHYLIAHSDKRSFEELREILEYLMNQPELHLNVSITNHREQTLLHTAAGRRYWASGKTDIELWKYLCEKNPNLRNAVDREGDTPFHSWLENLDIDEDNASVENNAIRQELDFWLQGEPPLDLVNSEQKNALEVYLEGRRRNAQRDLYIVRKLCEYGFVCNDLSCFSYLEPFIFKWYFDNVLKGDRNTLQDMLKVEWKGKGKEGNLVTEALEWGNADLVLTLMDCGYDIWKNIDLGLFLQFLFVGGDDNLKILQKFFNQWHWNPKLLKNFGLDQKGGIRTAVDLLLQCGHWNLDDCQNLMKFICDKVDDGWTNHRDLLRKSIHSEKGIDYSSIKTLEWLGENGAEPYLQDTVRALAVILEDGEYSRTWQKMLDHIEPLARGRNLPLPAENDEEDGKPGTTMLHAAIANGDLFFLRYLLEKMHIQISGKNADGQTPVEYAIDECRIVQLFWLLESMRSSLSPEFLSGLLCRIIGNYSRSADLDDYGDGPDCFDSDPVKIICMLVERYHADPRQPDDKGRIPLQLAPRGTVVWRYLNDRAQA